MTFIIEDFGSQSDDDYEVFQRIRKKFNGLSESKYVKFQYEIVGFFELPIVNKD